MNNMAQESGSNKSGRRTRGKKKPVTIDLNAEAETESETRDAAAADQPTEPQDTADAKSVDTGPSDTDAEMTAEKADAKETPSVSDSAASEADGPAPGSGEQPAADPATPPPAEQPRQGGGWFRSLVAAIIGGIISLGGYYGLTTTGVIETGGRADLDALQSADEAARTRLVSLESDVRGESGFAAKLNAADRRIAGLESGAAKLSESLAALPDLGKRLDSLTSDLDAAKAAIAAGGAGDGAAVAAMQSTMTALAEESRSGMDDLRQAEKDLLTALSALRDQVDALDQQVKTAAGSNTATDETAAALKAVADRLTALETATGQVPDTVAALSDQFAALQTRTEGLATELKSVRDDASRETETTAAAQAVTVAALNRAVMSGKPYAAELKAVSAFVEGSDVMAPLHTFAEKGIATRSDLTAAFPAVARSVLEQIGSEDDGIVARFWSNAQKVVSVRPTGNVEGDGPAAIIARIEAALGSGDLAAAHKEWLGLSDSGKTVSKDWADQLRARIDAEQSIGVLTEAALAALTHSKN